MVSAQRPRARSVSERLRGISAVAFLAFAFPFPAIAVGGGGGGGFGTPDTSSCTQDTWTCTEWSACDLNSEQRRECTKTFDCLSVETPPQPPGVQKCAPSCGADDWRCTGWSPCGPQRRQERVCVKVFECPTADTPKPTEEQACTLDCTGDLWNCADWSACGADGIQRRRCTFGFDCAGVETPKPVEWQLCRTGSSTSPPTRKATPPKRVVRPSIPARGAPAAPAASDRRLVCGNLTTLEERVRCRIGLDPEVLERELAIQYLPEECRALPSGAGRSLCVNRYRSLQPCWAQPAGPLRLACVRGVLGIGDLRADREECGARSGSDRSRCLAVLRAKAYPLITFRFYDLEERAEGLRALGAPTDLVVGFVVVAERAKQEFNRARSADERIAIIRRVQSAWRSFVVELPEAVKEKARRDGIGNSYE